MAGLAERTLQEGPLSGFKPQDVANTAWAFAILAIQNEALVAGPAERTLQQGFPSPSTCGKLPTRPGRSPHWGSRTKR